MSLRPSPLRTATLPAADEQITLLRAATKSYPSVDGARCIFENLTLTIRRFSRLVLIGPNACGKSSLLQVLLAYQQLDAGQVGLVLQPRDLLGTVLQDYRSQLLPWSSVATNLLLPLGGPHGIGISRQEVLCATRAFLDELDYAINLDHPIRQLSGGQQQAVVLARALAYQPDFFIWDEPTSAIDFSKRGALYHILQRSWRHRRTSAIIVTHDLDEALLLADRIIVFDAHMEICWDGEIEGVMGTRELSFLETDQIQAIRRAIRGAMTGSSRLGSGDMLRDSRDAAQTIMAR